MKYYWDYFVEICGLDTQFIGTDFTIDKKYELGGSGYDCITISSAKHKPSFDQVNFYANCLSYEHDLPAIIIPVIGKRKCLTFPIAENHRISKKRINDAYYDDINMIYNALFDMKYGNSARISFKQLKLANTSGINKQKQIDISYTTEYRDVQNEINLYSSALRQINPLSEFLDYYRVIESVSCSNGVCWIEKHLDKIKDYNFGYVAILTEPLINPKIQNIFFLYKKRALSRLNYYYKQKKTTCDIANYFYKEIRCGIAHGRKDVKIFDFKTDLQTIVQDNYIIKLLARMAIEEKMRGS